MLLTVLTRGPSPDKDQQGLRARRPSLLTLRHGIAVVNPVVTEAVRDIKNLHLSEAQNMKRVIGCSDVRAVAPGTATAIQDDRRVFGKFRNAGTKLLDASIVTRCTDVFGPRNMSLQVERAKTNVQD